MLERALLQNPFYFEAEAYTRELDAKKAQRKRND